MMASSYSPFGLNYPMANNPQMMGGGGGAGNCLQPGSHTGNCDPATARPVASDPQTGQSICICQYDRIVNTYRQYMHFSQAAAQPSSFSPANSNNNLDHPSVVGGGGGGGGTGAFSPASLQPPNAGHPADPIQAMYATHGPMRDPGGVFGDFKDISQEAAWRAAAVGMGMGMGPPNGSLAAAGCYGGYDPSLAAGVYSSNPYCTNGYAMDPTGMNRRKNATRETTSQLKHWLYEHRKNPYPTKGEKIMLAIVTKMTLTQVSTWFANARRRLKKENKMTWSPRNRGCEDDDKSDTEQMAGQDQDLDLDKSDDDSMSEMSSLTDENKRHVSVSPLGRDWKDPTSDAQSLGPTSQDCSVNKTTPTTMTSASTATKPRPRIWSLADVAMDRTTTTTSAPLLPESLALLPIMPATTRSQMTTQFPHNLHPHPHLGLGGMRGGGAAVMPPGGINFFPHHHHHGHQHQYGMMHQPAVSSGGAGVHVNLFTSNPNSAFSTPITPSSSAAAAPVSNAATNRFSSTTAATLLHSSTALPPSQTTTTTTTTGRPAAPGGMDLVDKTALTPGSKSNHATAGGKVGQSNANDGVGQLINKERHQDGHLTSASLAAGHSSRPLVTQRTVSDVDSPGNSANSLRESSGKNESPEHTASSKRRHSSPSPSDRSSYKKKKESLPMPDAAVDERCKSSCEPGSGKKQTSPPTTAPGSV